MHSKKILDVLRKKEVEHPPIWLMRQAGRYLPEYRKIRGNFESFLDLCYNPKIAAEITLQPLKRFDLDAAIVFSDILVIPHSLGLDLTFKENEGPKLDTVISESDLSKINVNEKSTKLQHTYDTLNIVKKELGDNKALIGFVGAPWTIATYMIEGGSSRDFLTSKYTAYSNKKFLDSLIEILIEQITYHINGQIASGADVIQIFDSWAGILHGEEYERFVIQPTRRIIANVRKSYPEVPIIGFPKGSGFLYEKYIKSLDVDAVSIDYNVSVCDMAKFQEYIVIQGNLDPTVLLCDTDVIKVKIDAILNGLVTNKNFIFNLGHGILKNTPVKNVQFLVDYIKNR